MSRMNALDSFRKKIAGPREYAHLEMLKYRLNAIIEELAAAYPKHNTPDLVKIAIDHGEMMTGAMWRQMKHLDDGENS